MGAENIGKAWDAATGLFRDQGGFIPAGMSIVRNETGKVEAVLNWEQLAQVKEMMKEGKSFAEAIAQLNPGNPSGAQAQGATEQLSTRATLPDVERAMTNIYAAQRGKQFFDEAGQIMRDSFMDIISPIDLPDFNALRERYTIKADDSGGVGRSSAQAPSDTFSSGVNTNQQVNPKPVENLPDVAEGGSGELNREAYLKDTVAAVKAKGLPFKAAVIATATQLVESNLKMYANRNVPESMNLPHEAVGSDHDSVGTYQQRPHWGPIPDLMNVFKSSGLFLNALTKFDWQNMDPGAAAQKVQVSAFPGKYSQRMAEAEQLLQGKFDSGGMIPPGLSLMENRTQRYEPAAAFTNGQWQNLEAIANGAGGDVDARMIIERLVVGDWAEARKELKQMGIRHQMRYAGRPKA